MNNMDISKYYAEWKKLDTKEYLFTEILFTWNVRKIKLQW